MPTRRALIAAAVLVFLAPHAGAEPSVSPNYRLETVHVPAAAFGGLARDGGALLVTDLAGGRLYRRDAERRLAAFGPIFPHGKDVIGDPTGPYRVARVGDVFVVAQGWTPANSEPGRLDHALVALDEAGGTRVVGSDFWNPFDFVAAADGFYVVDAARNSVEHLRANGERNTVVSFKRMKQAARTLQRLSPTEFSEDEEYETDAVPAGIARRDGRLYITLFGGFPFVAGAGKVVSVPETGDRSAPRVEAEGLNAPVAIAFADDGTMLVLEHGTYDQSRGFGEGTGRLLKLDGKTLRRETVLAGLTRPVSVLVWDERQLVVSDLVGNLHFLKR